MKSSLEARVIDANSPAQLGLEFPPEPVRASEIDESFVWWLWQSRRFDGESARKAGFDVVFPGWFSSMAGPDFRDAVIATGEGELRRGDVEVHVMNSAWKAHGHHRNPGYDDVILHVVLRMGATNAPETTAGDSIPTLALEPLLLAPLTDLLRSYRLSAPPLIECPFEPEQAKRAPDIVRAAGIARFESKVARLTGDVEAIGADEALYRLVAECLGYSANRAQFRRLAEAIPFQLLAGLSLFDSERLLLAAASITPDDEILRTYIDRPVLQAGELAAFRVRPGNSAAGRLRGLARLVFRHRQGFAAAIGATPPRDLFRLFVVEADTVLVGRGRADDAAINVGLTFLAGHMGIDGAAALHVLRAPPDNRWVAALRSKLTASGTTLRPYRAVHQQGLLDLSLRFCRYNRCEVCPLHL